MHLDETLAVATAGRCGRRDWQTLHRNPRPSATSLGPRSYPLEGYFRPCLGFMAWPTSARKIRKSACQLTLNRGLGPKREYAPSAVGVKADVQEPPPRIMSPTALVFVAAISHTLVIQDRHAPTLKRPPICLGLGIFALRCRAAQSGRSWSTPGSAHCTPTQANACAAKFPEIKTAC